MTRAISVALKAHYALGTTTIATCWKATLTDGTVVRTTSHDRDIVFDGETYLSVAAYSPSDIVSAADLSPDNLELDGFLSSPAITEEDILSGRWDYAAIELFEVNYADLTQGRNLIRSGSLGEINGDRSKFRVELRGLLQKLSRHIVRVTTKDCTADLGDARCAVNLATFTVTGSVTTATSQSQFTDSARTEESNWYTGGLLTWLTGENAGLQMEVRRSTSAGVIELQESMPFTVQVGDTYSMYAGCTKRFTEDCVGKFSNGVNFRGFPNLPLANVYKRGGT
jgi:uncharacterized phage protein (TIGR02218 family)